MSDHTPISPVARRSFLARLGAGMSVAGVSLVGGAPEAAAQAATGVARFQPARHTQDDWMDALPGKHRFVFDATTAPTFGAALAYANNFFVASESGYGLKDPDAAVIIVARHFATPFAYKDAIWAKYGTPLTGVTSLSDPKTKQPPTINLYNTAGYDNLANMGTTVDTRAQARRALRGVPDGDEVFCRHAGRTGRQRRRGLQRSGREPDSQLARGARRNRGRQSRAGTRLYAGDAGLIRGEGLGA